jgi:hypothetical protein
MTVSFTGAGTALTNRYSFNSGTIDFGNSRVVAVDNISITLAYTIADLFILGSIKAADKVRHSQKVTMTGKIKSYSGELEMMAAGSSTSGTPMGVNTLDGQPTYSSPVVTLFDRNGKQIQYQFSSALFKSTKLTSRMEDYSEWDFELEAIDIVEVYTA